MKSKLITAALVAIAGFAIADLIRAALFPNAATLAVDTSRPEPMSNPVAVVEATSTPTPGGAPPFASSKPSHDLAAIPAEAIPVPTLANDDGAPERHIVIQPGSDLVVIETDVAPNEADPQTAIIPASIGEAAASEAGVLEASAGTGDAAAPRVDRKSVV